MEEKVPRWVGIDLGSQAIGLAVICKREKGYELVLCEVLHLTSKPLAERLPPLYQWLKTQLESILPAEAVVIESPFVGRNARTAITLGVVQGLLWAILIEKGCQLMTLSPAEIKRTIAGRPHASKEQVAAMLVHHLHMSVPIPDSSHASDAVAIALAAAYHQNSPITRRFIRRAER
ncbi:MAG: crossover junction endodeoxyribonuclease RuvC [Bacteroidia bacterium]|nr:crossover junction endodeoxyribonuclease RuvC [Bacteroidia bacterium]